MSMSSLKVTTLSGTSSSSLLKLFNYQKQTTKFSSAKFQNVKSKLLY